MTRRRLAAAIGVICWLAIFAAFALSQIDKHMQGVAVAIAIPAAVVFFGVLAWLGRRS